MPIKRLRQLILFFILMTWIWVCQAQSWINKGSQGFEQLRLMQLSSVQARGNLKPFVSDGCSGFQSHNWQYLAKKLPAFARYFGHKPPWEACCIRHDRAYWRGDSKNGYNKRKKADQALKQCVINSGRRLSPQLAIRFNLPETRLNQLFNLMAAMMYQSVRVGGLPCSLLPWRWGYGWQHCAFAPIDQNGKLGSE